MTAGTRRASMRHVTVPGSPARVAAPAAALPGRWYEPALTAAERAASDGVAVPGWVADVEHALRRAARASRIPAGSGDWRDDLAPVVAPWADNAVRRLDTALADLPDTAVDRAALRSAFTGELSRRLVSLAAPVLVHELHRCRDAGSLTGEDGRARFVDFARRWATPAGVADLVVRYPVLARLAARECAAAVGATAELLGRFAADRDLLAGNVLDGPPAAVTAVCPGGDRHRGGRATSVVELADGARIVYKPRGVDAHLFLSRMVDLTNGLVSGLGLRTVPAVAGDGYGWTAHVRPEPLPALERATTYYRRVGGLLALLHLLSATDMHHENLVALGDQPMVVDVETLFHPRLGHGGPDPAAMALADSVARTGMLPAAAGRHGLTDVSGVGGDAGQPTYAEVAGWSDAGIDRMRRVRRAGRVRGGLNRPRWAGRPVEVADHAPAVLAGFGAVYEAVAGHREEFARTVLAHAELPVRVVVRPTRHYASALAGSTGPDALRDTHDRDHHLRTALAAPELPGALVEQEVTDLAVGDIPLFTTRADERGLRGGDLNLTGVFGRSGLVDVLARLAALDEFDRRDQEWIIAASLASRRTAVAVPAPVTAPVAVTAVGTDELLSAACSVADLVVSATYGADRVNWLGLEPVDDTRWLVLPMGAGFAHGYTGVALFLAQLGRISAVSRYLEVARHALDPLPDLLRGLDDQPELVTAVGAGGLTGFGGIAYALARLATVLGDDDVAGWARAAVPLAARAAAVDGPTGWADGLAGCAAALRAVDEEIGCAPARELAEDCAHRLVDPAAPSTLEWCRHGVSDPTDPAAGSPNLADLTLCHGELGRADLLLSASAAGEPDHHPAVVRRQAGRALAMLRRDGPRCATPDRVPTPGLLSGWSGIGYGLLRVGFPEWVPSALLLRPTPPHHT
ncbi:type 2 lanthipeptide synthetase LanM family protein [Actinophytocola sp.]|uniref:type 2 lanthipeptide synthetase LanM family protein n=1 Tax=Actinophytocola sp. TaxID=1872138 RepID=UPI003D6B4D93